jgi:hypothetical protein
MVDLGEFISVHRPDLLNGKAIIGDEGSTVDRSLFPPLRFENSQVNTLRTRPSLGIDFTRPRNNFAKMSLATTGTASPTWRQNQFPAWRQRSGLESVNS